ncbi:MAG: Crossover junction endodeoxyribonuclease RuvC [Holosporales bacterium]
MSLIVMGIDPGLVKAGYGLIHVVGNTLTPLACGVIKPNPDHAMTDRLSYLHLECKKIIEQYHPNHVAIEETFVNKNPTSALKLGMARGVLLMTPGLYNLPVYEYAANKIKKSVVGVGHAEKEQIIAMIGYIMPGIKQSLTPDSADALAIALCHINNMPR